MKDRAINREELAWAAGFFDGEGHVSYAESNGDYRTPMVRVMTCNTFLPVLERFDSALAGVGRICVMHAANPERNRKASWQWYTSSFCGAQAAIAMLWEFLSEQKREAAAGAFAAYHARRADMARTKAAQSTRKFEFAIQLEV